MSAAVLVAMGAVMLVLERARRRDLSPMETAMFRSMGFYAFGLAANVAVDTAWDGAPRWAPTAAGWLVALPAAVFFFGRAYREVRADRDWDAPLRDVHAAVLGTSRNRLMVTAIVVVMALVLIGEAGGGPMAAVGVALVALAIRLLWAWPREPGAERVTGLAMKLAYGLLVLFVGALLIGVLVGAVSSIVNR